MASVRARRHAAATLAVVVVATLAASPAAAWTVAQSDHITKTMSWDVECDKSSYVPFVEGCHTSQCGRYVVDDFVSEDDLATLRGIVEKGMASQPATGGPTILDINSGFIKGPAGLAIIYPEVEFSQEEYDTYAAVFTKIRATIMGAFGSEVEQLWFTAPTFITREIGEEGWEPAEIHDEYWHEHVDKDNTEHYDYSGLLYLTDYGLDFEGGRLEFHDGDENHYVEPRRNRFVYFSSGRENPHRVEKVTSGTRYVMSMWFTCNKEREFGTFLDGKAHNTYQQRAAAAGSDDSGSEL